MTDDFSKDFEANKGVRASMYDEMRPAEYKGLPPVSQEVIDKLAAEIDEMTRRGIIQPKEHCLEPQAPRRRWWQHEQFPLLPVWRYSPADEWNEANIHFQWLLFTIFTMPMPDLEVKFELTATALQLVIQALYVRLMIYIPFPHAVERFVYNRLGRYPRKW